MFLLDFTPPSRIWNLSSWSKLFLTELWKGCDRKVEKQIIFGNMLWSVWKTRNDRLLKGVSSDPRVTVEKAFSLADECRRLLAHMDAPLKCAFRKCQEKVLMSLFQGAQLELMRLGPLMSSLMVVWMAFLELQEAGFVVVQNKPFKVVGAGYSSWLWASPLRAEGEAIRQGVVLFARKKTTGPLCICSDAEAIVQLIQQAGPGPPPLQDIVKDIRNTYHEFKCCFMCYKGG
ncbi:hypothetical protein QJS04_geneDACA010161 [Acorus gramineus]|uniref:Uncharacterized protein n=1 Tax=Acorus gramineus TaxID=55184 RepID=A0AAV9A6P7_ACOGR|nr:hypothetical protein QJS04_geneDACA010161 [Acorus gramineus]